MNVQQRTRITSLAWNNRNGFLFALVLAAGWVAAWDYEAGNRSRRANALETLLVGLERIFTGEFTNEQATSVLIGRILLAAAILLAALLVGRRLFQAVQAAATH